MNVIIKSVLANDFISDYFIELLNTCVQAVNKEDLRNKVENLFNSDDTTISTYFDFGYTQKYMWIRERGFNNDLFIVEFNN